MYIRFFKSIYSDSSEDVLNFVEDCFLNFYYRDKETADDWLMALCQIKISCPEFKIEFSSSDDNSFYDYFSNKIIISSKTFFNDRILFHEVAHALYFNKYGDRRPRTFDTIIENIRIDQNKMYNIISLVSFCRNHLLELESKVDFVSKKLNNISKDEMGKVVSDENIKKYNCLIALEDIIDAILRGTAYENGVSMSKDNNHYCTKLGKISGHGKEYFSEDNSVFHEILADYFSIVAVDKDFRELVDSVLGKEMVDMLNGLYDDLIYSFKKVEIKSANLKNIK